MNKNINILILLLFPFVVFSQIEVTCENLVIAKAPDAMLDKHILGFVSQNESVNSTTLLDNEDINRNPRTFICQVYNLENVVSGLSIENTPVGIDNVYLLNYRDNESLNATLDTIGCALLEADGMLGNYELFSYFKRRAIFFVNNKYNRLTVFLYNPFGSEVLNKQVDYFIKQHKKDFDQIIEASGLRWILIKE